MALNEEVEASKEASAHTAEVIFKDEPEKPLGDDVIQFEELEPA